MAKYSVIAAFALLGCTPSDSTRESARRQADSARIGSAADEARRVAFGPYSFTPPAGWEKKESEYTVNFMVPDGPTLRKFRFRAVVGLKKRPPAGCSLEEFKAQLEKLLAEGSAQINEFARQENAKSGTAKDHDISLTNKLECSVAFHDLDGTQVLAKKSYAVANLDGKSVAAKTQGYTFLTDDGNYTLNMTYPLEVEKEMDVVWTTFERTLQIQK